MLNVDDKNTPGKDKLRALPSIDRLLAGFDGAVGTYGHEKVADALRAVIEDRRERILAGQSPSTDEDSIREAAGRILATSDAARLRRVFNLTGTVLHTNLVRASPAAARPRSAPQRRGVLPVCVRNAIRGP